MKTFPTNRACRLEIVLVSHCPRLWLTTGTIQAPFVHSHHSIRQELGRCRLQALLPESSCIDMLLCSPSLHCVRGIDQMIWTQIEVGATFRHLVEMAKKYEADEVGMFRCIVQQLGMELNALEPVGLEQRRRLGRGPIRLPMDGMRCVSDRDIDEAAQKCTRPARTVG